VDRGNVFVDARGEGGDQALACGGNPWDQIGLSPFSDHRVEAVGEGSEGGVIVRRVFTTMVPQEGFEPPTPSLRSANSGLREDARRYASIHRSALSYRDELMIGAF
jgi:hypothetical protein